VTGHPRTVTGGGPGQNILPPGPRARLRARQRLFWTIAILQGHNSYCPPRRPAAPRPATPHRRSTAAPQRRSAALSPHRRAAAPPRRTAAWLLRRTAAQGGAWCGLAPLSPLPPRAGTAAPALPRPPPPPLPPQFRSSAVPSKLVSTRLASQGPSRSRSAHALQRSSNAVRRLHAGFSRGQADSDTGLTKMARRLGSPSCPSRQT